MVRDVPNFFYGDVQTNAPIPYPHKGVMTEDGMKHLIDCVTAAKETLGTSYGLAVDAGASVVVRGGAASRSGQGHEDGECQQRFHFSWS